VPEEKHNLHIEIPRELWEEFKRVVPETGVTSIILRRLMKAYIAQAKDASASIDFKKLIL